MTLKARERVREYFSGGHSREYEEQFARRFHRQGHLTDLRARKVRFLPSSRGRYLRPSRASSRLQRGCPGTPCRSNRRIHEETGEGLSPAQCSPPFFCRASGGSPARAVSVE